MPIAVPRYTVDEIESWPDDGNRYELLDGFLLVSPAPGAPHQVVATQLAAELRLLLRDWPDLRVVAPGVVLQAPWTELQPDVLVFRQPPGELAWKNVRDFLLAVEVESRSSKVYDREYKRPAYLNLGVAEVWRVEIDTRRVRISKPDTVPDMPRHGRLAWEPRGLGRVLTVELDRVFEGIPDSE